MLSRPGGSTVAMKMRLEPTRARPQQRVHPGHDWLFVLTGRIRLSLGEREITVDTGEAAEFATTASSDARRYEAAACWSRLALLAHERPSTRRRRRVHQP